MLSQHRNNSVESTQKRYSGTVKEFALTLYFYSTKAYNFLRTKFHLPSSRTIRKWLASFNCKPGFLQEVFNFLKTEVEVNSHLKNCALIMDSMAIRKQSVPVV